MSNINPNSPLYRIRHPLIILRWTLGFPLQVMDGKFFRFRFVTWLEIIRFTILMLILLLEHEFWAILTLISDRSFDDFYDFYESNMNRVSASKIDKWLTWMFRIANMMFSFVLLLLFKWNAKKIENLCQDVAKQYTNISAMLRNQHEETTSSCKGNKLEYATRTLIYGQILNFISSILWGLWMYYYLLYNAGDAVFVEFKSFIRATYPILVTIEMLFMGFGPIASSTELIVGHIVDSITELFCKWNKVLDSLLCPLCHLCHCDKNTSIRSGAVKQENNGQNKENKSFRKERPDAEVLLSEHILKHEYRTNDIEEVMDTGLKLESLVLATNQIIQGLIATSFISIVVCLVVLLFIVICGLGLNDSTTENLRVIFASAASIGSTMYLLRFYRLMNSGERLWNKLKRSRRTFEDRILLSKEIRLGDDNRQKSYVLQKRLDFYQYASPISPYAVFGLNSKTFCATFATIISYVIILIKLRGVDNVNSIMTSSSVNDTAIT